MVLVVLLLIIGGIGLSQAVSDPYQVTLRWLRLGGLVALGLLAVVVSVYVLTEDQGRYISGIGILLLLVAVLIQLTASSIGKRSVQRWAALSIYLLVVWTVSMALRDHLWLAGDPYVIGYFHISMSHTMGGMIQSIVMAGMLGGYLMAMLLGHAYLTSGNEMTQAPFLRLVWMLIILLLLRALSSGVLGLMPYMAMDHGIMMDRIWGMMMVWARIGVGLIVPGVFLYMIHDCIRRKANQSATGILYVSTVLVMLGEGIALTLQDSTGCLF